MRFAAATTRPLQAELQAELRDLERAVAAGTRDAGSGLKAELRRQVTNAGLGPRLATSWDVTRDRHYPNQKLDAASPVYTRAPQIIRAFDEGTLIRSRRGRFLALPTGNAPRNGTDGKRISPSTFPEHRFGPLRFVPRSSGPSLLVVDGLRASFSQKTGELRGFRRGDTVVEIGCGTGLNFALIEERIGPEGRLIGVDLTDAMLARARERVRAYGWTNVELVECPAASYHFPPGVDGVLSTFALTLEPDYDRVIANGAEALKPGRRWVVLDLKLPSNRLLHRLAPLLILLARPFAVSMAVARRRPWESLDRHLKNTSLEELYLGVAYIARGEA